MWGAIITLILWVALLTVFVRHGAGSGAAVFFGVIVTAVAIGVLATTAGLELNRRIRNRPRPRTHPSR